MRLQIPTITGRCLGLFVAVAALFSGGRGVCAAPAVTVEGGKRAFSTVLHVSPDGSDENSGGRDSPFRTVSKALAAARPGAKILVVPGVYNERIHAPTSGRPGRPIVVEGARTADGGWGTILDGSVPLKVKWTPAPEVGSGVYQTKAAPFEPYLLTVGGKQVPRIWPNHMNDGTGFERLAYPADKEVTTVFLKAKVKYWDVIGAMYGYKDGTTYIRFREGDDPNEHDLRAAPEGGVIAIENQSRLVFRNLLVRGGQDGVLITGTGATHNIIENCRFVGGQRRVFITDGASANLIRSNQITAVFYGDRYRPGAWGGPRGVAAPYENRVKEHFYNEYKWFFGPGGTSDFGVLVKDAGPGNEICRNDVSVGGQGIHVCNCSDVKVYENTVRHFSSIGLICSMDRVRNVQFYDNLAHDCNLNLRIHHVNEMNQEADRSLYVYRNRFYQNPGVGTHVFMHYHHKDRFLERNKIPGEYNHAQVFIYHNSFAGGNEGISMSGYAAHCGGLPKGVLVNNVLSCDESFKAATNFLSREGMFAAFDYNWLGGRFRCAESPWCGAHNILEPGEAMWDSGQMPTFTLPKGSAARNAGLDLSRPFSVHGKRYGPLPGMKPNYFSGSQPDLGAGQSTE